jgi:glycosyltransferase involved in cell wall biosynthesis
MFFSLIIPVFNRPDEIDELLLSLTYQYFSNEFEVVIVEDGSSLCCELVVLKYKNELNIQYYFKENTGPGDSRNFGMSKALGDYYIILDSDCIVPPTYLSSIALYLSKSPADCFGGPDTAHDDFSDVQKAINFSMTSFLTTGGIRGGGESLGTFQPRSFNMGLSKKAFETSGGFDSIHPGEDPDLVFRLWRNGFKTVLIKEAFVYHKRRINWSKFFIQVNKFGKVRPILNQRYPEFSKLSFWFPSIFIIGIDVAIVFVFFGFYAPILFLGFYFLLLFFWSALSNKSLKIASLTIIAVIIQLYGYGLGFLESTIKVKWMKNKPEVMFPELFFKK